MKTKLFDKIPFVIINPFVVPVDLEHVIYAVEQSFYLDIPDVDSIYIGNFSFLEEKESARIDNAVFLSNRINTVDSVVKYVLQEIVDCVQDADGLESYSDLKLY